MRGAAARVPAQKAAKDASRSAPLERIFRLQQARLRQGWPLLT